MSNQRPLATTTNENSTGDAKPNLQSFGSLRTGSPISNLHSGRVMALDLGEKRIGVAISDPTRTIASSYGVVKRKSRREDFERYRRIIEEEKVTLLVVGLPITLGGEEGRAAAWVRDYAAELGQRLEIPIEFWDESLTTVEAEASLRARGQRGKKARQRVDAVAAAFILQNYLDAHA